MRLPEYPRPGSKQPVEQSIRQIIDYLRAITVTSVTGGKLRQSTSGTTIAIPKTATTKRQYQRPNPFDVSLIKQDDAWKVTVADGYVNERIPGGEEDALKAHYPQNISIGDGATPPDKPTDRVPFSVSAGQQVSLVVEVDEKGAIEASGEDDAVRVVIEDVDPESIHYVPKIGSASTGEAGSYHYKLATIEAPETEGGAPVLKLFLAGSHISHFRDLPLLINRPVDTAENVGRIIKEYDKPSNEYRFRSIGKGDGQLRVNEDGDHVNVRGNGKALTLRYQVAGESAVDLATFVDGLTTSEGTATIPIPALGGGDGMHLNVHVMTQGEGTDPDGWVRIPTAVKTLCFRSGIFVGAFDQASPSAFSEIFTSYEASAPAGLISVRVSSIAGVS